MPLPNHLNAGPVVSACDCPTLSGLATSKFCPDCGQPRAAQYCPAPVDTAPASLSEQLLSPLDELSFTALPANDTDCISQPVVIAANNWALNNDPAAPAVGVAPAQPAQWRSNQPFDMRTVLLSATTAFTAFAFLFLATSRGPVRWSNDSGRGPQVAAPGGEMQPEMIQPASPNLTAATARTGTVTPDTASAARVGDARVTGARVSNEPARPQRANGAGRSTLVPRIPNVEINQQIAPASIGSLPRLVSRSEARDTVVPTPMVAAGNNAAGNSGARNQTFISASTSGPLRAVGARPVYVAVSPGEGAPDELNASSDAASTTGRYTGTNGYLIVNGRVVVDGTTPQITIQSPNPNGNYVGYFPALQGAANSSAGVAAVELEIERVASGGSRAAYWDGAEWAPAATRLDTTVSNGFWRYTGVLPDDGNLVAGYYRVRVYASGFRGPERKTAPSATLRIRVFPKGPPV